MPIADPPERPANPPLGTAWMNPDGTVHYYAGGSAGWVPATAITSAASSSPYVYTTTTSGASSITPWTTATPGIYSGGSPYIPYTTGTSTPYTGTTHNPFKTPSTPKERYEHLTTEQLNNKIDEMIEEANRREREGY